MSLKPRKNPSTLVANLTSSAKFFAEEAIDNALSAKEKAEARWPLAIFHLVISLEHFSKALLAEQNAVFIHEVIDKPGKTTSLQKTFQRLTNRDIYGLNLSPKDMKRIETAVAYRNDVAHGTIGQNSKALEAKFFEIFAFLRDFLRYHLQIGADELASRDKIDDLLAVQKQISEIEKRAKESLEQHDVCWNCVECGKDFLVELDGKCICLFCHNDCNVIECDRCCQNFPEYEIYQTDEIFEWEFSEGRATLANDFGITEKFVCQICYSNIQKEAAERAYQDELDETWFYTSGILDARG
ncbi:MAG: hypothetical protein ACU0FH_18785 [Heliomarina sp.]|uniref:hypothetical protein n=1 Tax=Heliomarina sp. TaxID=2917556 RepID=UPI0040589E15